MAEQPFALSEGLGETVTFSQSRLLVLDDFLFAYNLLHFTLRAEEKSSASLAKSMVGLYAT